MKFAGRFIDLLGHQMYGGAVPAVAEFIANAWDADADKVEIFIPDDIRKKDAQIIVKDCGEGMNYEVLNDCYLNVGYERRKLRGERTAKKRLVMGRKGIGKLAGFGIAENIVIRSVKEGHLIQFKLNYTELKNKIELSGYAFEPDKDEPITEENGVAVILEGLKIDKNINITEFRKSIARRFALNSEIMKIIINSEALKKEDLEFEYRIPEKKSGWIEEDIANFGKVKFWFGFLKNTIKDKELRGISVFARDRVAQFTPFHFNLSGGINGQVGLEYLTGQVKAEVLDEDIDYIATPRQTINWQFDKAPILEQWGQSKIKSLCRDWKKRKDESNLKLFKHDYSELYPRIEVLHEQERKDVIMALEKISKLERIQSGDFKIIANSMISGIERESVKKVINKINASSPNALPELYEAIKEWDIISAVSIAEVIIGKLEIIRQFKKHIDDKLLEKSNKDTLDMQIFIKEHPWLLGPEYEHLNSADIYHEKGLDSWITDVIKIANKEYSRKDAKEGKRFDLLCVKDDTKIVILELMRPSKLCDYDHLMRLERYVSYLQNAIDEKGTESSFKRMIVNGLLIADDFVKDGALLKTLQKLSPGINAIKWKPLFERVEASYKEYFEILRMKAPDDPRIKGLI